MTESGGIRLRSAPNFEEMEIEGRGSIWRGPLCAVFGKKITKINFTANVAGFFATNTAVFNVVFTDVSSTAQPFSRFLNRFAQSARNSVYVCMYAEQLEGPDW